MRILASVIVIIGLLVAIGGIAGLINHNPTGIIRLIVGIVLVLVAIALKPKNKDKAKDK